MITPPIDRRVFLKAGVTGCLTSVALPAAFASAVPKAEDPSLDDRIEGMLLGSLIGDALGGPVEFQDPSKVATLASPPKRWTDGEKLDAAGRATALERLKLRPYEPLRPVPEPFAHWLVDAPPGTITDDSRHKMVLLDALRTAQRRSGWPLDGRGLARTYLDWPISDHLRRSPDTVRISSEWLQEWVLASRWVLGERDLSRALPPERIWNGLATCCGQMTLLPLAALFPGDPEKAYRAAYSLAYFDNGWGRDLNAALVAGLAAALTVPVGAPAAEAWATILDAMRTTDPFRYGKVPWSQRSVDRWLGFALAAARAAESQPARLFQRLDAEFKDTIKWEAQVPFVVTFGVLALCEHSPLTALQLSIEWGHDTDSYAQLLGAFIGARHGTTLFPAHLVRPVRERLKEEYAEDVAEWVSLLRTIRRLGHRRPVISDFGA
jgi:ADP-ribosylglycohydrolase